MEVLIETFHIDLKLIIAQLFNFAVVFVVLYVFAIKPLMKIMRERTEKIEKGIGDADRNAKKLEQAEKEYKSLVAQAKTEANEIVKNAKADADQKRQEMVTRAKGEVNDVVTQGKNQLAQEKVKMVQEAKAEVIELVTNATKTVLGQAVDAKIDAGVVEKSIKEIS